LKTLRHLLALGGKFKIPLFKKYLSLTNPVVNELGESKATKGSLDFSNSLTNGHGICQRTNKIK